MAMRLDGSCQCGKVRFSVDSETPYPFMYCYCSICRKTSGSFGVNVMGKRATLRIRGKRHLRCFHAVMREPGRRARRSEAERWFCSLCGSHLWLLDDRWPEGVWPSANALDTPLPDPPSRVHIMLRYKPDWVPDPGRGEHRPRYPDVSIAGWHESHGLTVRGTRPAPAKRPRLRKRATAARHS
jgi:hypothetical protein